MSVLLSPCHSAVVKGSGGDGVLVGSCIECGLDVIRINQRTGLREWLDGNSSQTRQTLRPVADEFQAPETLARLPIFDLISPCHAAPVDYVRDDMSGLTFGRCGHVDARGVLDCREIFVRIQPGTGRIQRIASPDGRWITGDDPDLAPWQEATSFIDLPEQFQPRRLKRS